MALKFNGMHRAVFRISERKKKDVGTDMNTRNCRNVNGAKRKLNFKASV